jgi:hypothetical protein
LQFKQKHEHTGENKNETHQAKKVRPAARSNTTPIAPDTCMKLANMSNAIAAYMSELKTPLDY